MPLAFPPARTASPTARCRRSGSGALLAVYVWLAALFPMVHAAAEAPGGTRVHPVGQEVPERLPPGHDHLTCHFCAAAATLLAPAPTVVAPVLPVSLRLLPVAGTRLETAALAWAHLAIPARAPPTLA